MRGRKGVEKRDRRRIEGRKGWRRGTEKRARKEGRVWKRATREETRREGGREEEQGRGRNGEEVVISKIHYNIPERIIKLWFLHF